MIFLKEEEPVPAEPNAVDASPVRGVVFEIVFELTLAAELQTLARAGSAAEAVSQEEIRLCWSAITSAGPRRPYVCYRVRLSRRYIVAPSARPTGKTGQAK